MHFALLILIFLFSCQGGDLTQEAALKRKNQKGEFIARTHDQITSIPQMEVNPPPAYSWSAPEKNALPRITKEHFRCKGSISNPVRSEVVRGEQVLHYDCGGSERHSLYLIDGKEGVYPILIDLLNFVQQKTGKRVIITSGYRCPAHNTYVDSQPSNQTSKHMIAAEVNFYVQGLEQKPEEIVRILKDYYKGQKGYEDFQRYEKPDCQVSTQPWMNKEIFIKLYKPKEGRNFDNRHSYPYLSIQVRHDRDKNQRVTYSWDLALRGYHRY
jgi:hypothetical protein